MAVDRETSRGSTWDVGTRKSVLVLTSTEIVGIVPWLIKEMVRSGGFDQNLWRREGKRKESVEKGVY